MDRQAAGGWNSPEPERGLIDMNYAHDDGSVLRIGGAKFDDDRFAEVPYNHDASAFPINFTQYVPR